MGNLSLMNEIEIKHNNDDNHYESIFYGYKLLQNSFIQRMSNNFIYLNKFIKLFPNLEIITIFGNDKSRNQRVVLLPDLIKDLLRDLPKTDKLLKIVIINPREKKMAIYNTLETYK